VEAVTKDTSLVLCSLGNGSFVGASAQMEREHSPVVMAELKGQLVCCQQLLQLEPDSKCETFFKSGGSQIYTNFF
jgi:hypothetical protein